ncbi:MAG: PIN domain-containing protein [Desulfuromonadaceae bacterium]|nr:PIN domain-containing protein [Desulfuromonadaceae bacterium]
MDTNIWLYVYAPQAPDDWKTRIYSRSLVKILTAKSRIFIDALVLSEFINRYARLAYNLFKAAGSTINFKEYRQSPDFKPVAKDIESSVRRILKHCQRTESSFSDCDINSLLAKYGEGNSDFNDQLMVELCKSKGFKLITHDRDFKDCGVTVLTANNRLLT